MNKEQAIQRMIGPGEVRPKKSTRGVIQILVTSDCDLACWNCTQGSNLRRPTRMMSLGLFEEAVLSVKTYWGIVGLFGGNPALHPEFGTLCEILRKHIPKTRLGLWCNNPINESKAKAMRETFNPAVSNLNVHLKEKAYRQFRKWWPESRPFGLKQDSRHSPVFVSQLNLLDMTESERWEAIANCDINQRWSAGIGMFRGHLRAWFCEIAMSQSLLKQDEPDYPDTGVDPSQKYAGKFWWELGMDSFGHQVEQHCQRCAVPLRGAGSLAQSVDGVNTISKDYREVYLPKPSRPGVEFVELKTDLQSQSRNFVNYLEPKK